MPPRAFAPHSGRRSVTKSRRGGGGEERPQRPLPTLSTSPHPAREEEQFVYLGLQESFPPPSSRRPPSPSFSPPSSARSCPVPPAAPSLLPLLFLLPHPSSPPSPPSRCAVVGEGAGGALSAWRPGSTSEAARLGGALRPAALPPSPGPPGPPETRAPHTLQPRILSRARKEEADSVLRKSVCHRSRGGRFWLYKQEAESHGHTVAFLIVPGGGARAASRL